MFWFNNVWFNFSYVPYACSFGILNNKFSSRCISHHRAYAITSIIIWGLEMFWILVDSCFNFSHDYWTESFGVITLHGNFSSHCIPRSRIPDTFSLTIWGIKMFSIAIYDLFNITKNDKSFIGFSVSITKTGYIKNLYYDNFLRSILFQRVLSASYFIDGNI